MASNASIDSHIVHQRKPEHLLLENQQMPLSRARSKDALPQLEFLQLGMNKYSQYGGVQKIREEGRKES